MLDNEEEYLSYLEKQVIKDVDERSINGTYIYFVAWLLIGVATGFYQDNSTIFWTLAYCLLAFSLVRIGVRWFYQKKPNANQTVRIKWMYFNVLIPAIIYSLLFSAAITSKTFEPLFIYLLMVILALLSTGVVIFAPMKKLSLSFLTCLTAMPFLSAMLLNNDRFIEGLMLVLYSTYMLAQATKLHQEYLTNLKKSYRLDQLNQQDSLTGIANRRKFDEAFDSAWKSALRSKVCLSLILIDIDYFKKVNDQYGHVAGDEVIKNIAQIIKTTCQRETDVVARLGGEEYAVLLKNYESNKLENFVEKIRMAIEATVTLSDEHTIQVTASLGVAYTLADLDKSTHELFKVADKNLYTAKDLGRNRAFISRY